MKPGGVQYVDSTKAGVVESRGTITMKRAMLLLPGTAQLST